MIIFCITGLKYIKINVTCFRFMRPLETLWLHMQLALYLRHCPGSLRAPESTGPTCSKHRPGIGGHPGICWRHYGQQAPSFMHTHLKVKHGNFYLLPEVEPHFKVIFLLGKQLYFFRCLIQQVFTETCSPEPPDSCVPTSSYCCCGCTAALLLRKTRNMGSENGLLCFSYFAILQ